ncbi:hypothetical protein OJ998_01300 [Solirubrobacter taibaiensis]|nr:hypothetical protein [Solirubrobacter taibaiensis]
MAPESEARERALYDHESEPRRPRRAAADWGVNEDIFDRMPSRFGRVERRPEHQEIVLRRDVDHTSVAVIELDGGRFEREEAAAWTRETGRGEPVRGSDDREARRAETVARIRGEAGRGEPMARVRAEAGSGEPVARVRGEAGREARGAGAVWTHGDEVERGAPVRGDAPGRVTARTERTSRSETGELDPRAAARAMMSWGEDLDDEAAPMVPGETRTIVLSRDDEPQYDEFADAPRRDTSDFEALSAESRERKTIKISGHPDRLPAPRTQRPPMTVAERIGHRPDRIVGYAVALGFLLVLIAVLTTGQ